ncbi:MAG TPA: DnaJ domain-containing protein [Allosphingosinicella sp.]|nr:DnaJ domain-containing protein [Allosphingosinicella sp.]
MGFLLKLLIGLVVAALIYAWLRRSLAAPAMRTSEARTLLGVGEGASIDDIRAAHRRLIAKVHPDAGGSAGLATRVNAARDALIAELKRAR